jgi:hypothetical protein
MRNSQGGRPAASRCFTGRYDNGAEAIIAPKTIAGRPSSGGRCSQFV